jgi:hypothetical protein
MGDQGTTDATKVDLGQGSREEQQGGPEKPQAEKKDGEENAPAIGPRPGR